MYNIKHIKSWIHNHGNMTTEPSNGLDNTDFQFPKISEILFRIH